MIADSDALSVRITPPSSRCGWDTAAEVGDTSLSARWCRHVLSLLRPRNTHLLDRSASAAIPRLERVCGVLSLISMLQQPLPPHLGADRAMHVSQRRLPSVPITTAIRDRKARPPLTDWQAEQIWVSSNHSFLHKSRRMQVHGRREGP